VLVENTGDAASDEVVQLYLKDQAASVPVPIQQLVGFDRIHLAPGETQRVAFTLTPRQMSVILDDGRRVVEPGEFRLFAGGGQPGTGASGAFRSFVVSGADLWEVPGG